MARAPLVRPTDAPPTAHEPGQIAAREWTVGPAIEDAGKSVV